MPNCLLLLNVWDKRSNDEESKKKKMKWKLNRLRWWRRATKNETCSRARVLIHLCKHNAASNAKSALRFYLCEKTTRHNFNCYFFCLLLWLDTVCDDAERSSLAASLRNTEKQKERKRKKTHTHTKTDEFENWRLTNWLTGVIGACWYALITIMKMLRSLREPNAVFFFFLLELLNQSNWYAGYSYILVWS